MTLTNLFQISWQKFKIWFINKICFLLLKQQKGNNFLLQEDFLLVVFSSCFRFQSLLSFLNIYLYLDQVTLFKAAAKKAHETKWNNWMNR